jgi:Zn-dependent alcohol dehydrogenase
VRRVSAPSVTETAATVVTVGAGASALPAALLADGYRVIAVDISAAALDTLLRGIDGTPDLLTDGRLRLVVADVRTLQLAEPVDVWHDRAVFHFLVEPSDRRAYAAAAAGSVRSGGHLVLSSFAPTGPTACSGLPVERHDAESLTAAFSPSFVLLDAVEADHVTPWGTTQRFVHATFRRR